MNTCDVVDVRKVLRFDGFWDLVLIGFRLKPKKTNQKRQREPRFAFMTKSEVDHLELRLFGVSKECTKKCVGTLMKL